MSIRSNMDARRADQRIEFHRNTPTRDSSGSLVDSWALLKETWAAVDGAKGTGEHWVQPMTVQQADYIVWVRADIVKRLTVTVADRIFWKGRRFNIKDMPDQQLRGRWVAIICNTGLNEG